MNRKAVLVGLIGAVGLLLGVAFGIAVTWGPSEEFCAAYAVALPLDEHPVTYGELVILDHSYRERDPCRGHDLWHYMDQHLDGVDGVLFEDCTISWVAGGRTSAEDAGVPCQSS
ncbi:MAG: hypothetical protein GY724_21780 [Actinomycetia bacterium]|nr:hypothetical protein [Actinomycetes bacterium]MCP5034470.1 hypothetical protein [Actinomycetes bacterium]